MNFPNSLMGVGSGMWTGWMTPAAKSCVGIV